jgi:hypothetical protein
MAPLRRARIPGSTAWIVRIAPKYLQRRPHTLSNRVVIAHVENDGRDAQRLGRRQLQKLSAGFEGAQTRVDVEPLACDFPYWHGKGGRAALANSPAWQLQGGG